MTTPDLAAIVDALAGKREGNSYRVLCPVHNGRSLIVTEEAGKILINCKNGCEQGDVIAALRDRDLWPTANGQLKEPLTQMPQQGEALVEVYEYRDTDGTLQASKGRFRTFSGKTFKWRLPNEEEWSGLRGRKEATLPLFGADLLAESDGLVIFTEGEKAAKACRAVGFTAVCGAGSASQRNFGDALTVLKGRDVVLWPDRDDAGRGLMRHLAQELNGVAKSVRTVAPDVPPAGDAHDYFAGAGTVAAIMELLAQVHTEPWIEETAEGYLVSLPEEGGRICFNASDVDSTRNRSLDIMLNVWRELPGTMREHFSGRLNVTSLSNRETFRRQLDDMFGKEGGWTRRLNIACNMLLKAHNERDNSIVLLEAPDIITQHMLPPYLLTEGPTITFGQGGSGKTYLALAWAACIALGIPFLASPVRQAAVLFVDYESSAGMMKKRLEKVLAGMGMSNSLPPIFYWEADAPLADMVPALQREIRKDAIGAIVVDSVVLACGGDAERSEIAGRYFGALRRLGLPSNSIAHVTKAGGDLYPFGSIFWHNSARLTWNVKLRHDEGDTVHVGLFNRKINDGALAKPRGLQISFDGTDGPVKIEREGLDAEWDKELSNAERIRGELRLGKCSVKELAAGLDLSEAAVRKTLNQRMDDAQNLNIKAVDGSDYWGLTTRNQESA